MRIKTIVDEDFTNYKKASMFIGTISCSGKCCKEANIPVTVCQNYEWIKSPIIHMDDKDICKRYVDNQLTSAMVIGGLEPFEQPDELHSLIRTLREEFQCEDDVVIYTGYDVDEIEDKLDKLRKYPNIILKCGRFVPNSTAQYDEILGVTLASENQYGVRLS